MAEPAFDEAKVAKYLRYSQWVWLIGSVISVVTAIGAAVMLGGSAVGMVLLAVSCVQAAIAIPAALMLSRRANWARLTLWILAAISIGSLYQAFQLHAWPSLLLNLVLATTLGTLGDRGVRAACKATTATAP